METLHQVTQDALNPNDKRQGPTIAQLDSELH